MADSVTKAVLEDCFRDGEEREELEDGIFSGLDVPLISN